MSIKRMIFLILLFTGLYSSIYASISVNAYADQSNTAKGEIFQFVVEVSGVKTSDIDQPILPNIPFENMGVSTSSSSSISVINGKVSKSQKTSYSYSLRALTIGKFKIPPVNVRINKSIYKSNSVEITVTNARKSKNNNSNNQSYKFATDNRISDKDIFIVSEPSKTVVYKNEPILLKYILYTKYNLKINRLGSEPNYNGFWKEELPDDGIVSLKETRYKGQKYYYAVIRALSLSPNKTGMLTIPSFSLFVEALVSSSGFWGFDDSKPLKLTSNPISIRALELPAPPVNCKFSGAVGKFTIDSQLSPLTLKAGETAMFTLNIQGNGNLTQAANPTFPEISKLKILDPEVESNLSFNNNIYNSSRKFKYAILPQDEGIYIIPPLTFCYFDPVQRKYVNLKTEAYKINVRRGNIVLTGNNLQKSINEEGSDIGFIVTDISFDNYIMFFQSFYFWLFIALLFSSIPIHYLYKLEQDKLSSNLEYLRNRTANKVLKRYLKEASNAFHHHHSDQFYDSAQKGILLYLADKIAISRGSTQAEIMEKLKEHLTDEMLLHELELFIEKCSQFKYMPNKDNSNTIRADYHQLKQIVARLTKMIH